MTNANETAPRLSYAAYFNRSLVVVIDRAALVGIAPFERGEMESFICDALHAAELFGPRTFITIRED